MYELILFFFGNKLRPLYLTMFAISHVSKDNANWARIQKRFSNGRLLRGLCHGDVASEPIRRYYLPSASGILVAETTRSPKRIVGISIYEVTEEYAPGKSMYIHVLCSRLKGIGLTLMTEARRVASDLGLRWIRLGALAHVIGYYRKMGFRATSHPECREQKAVTRVAERIAHLRFHSSAQASADPRIQAAQIATMTRSHQNLGDMLLCIK
jgi:hypothetical protein